MCACEKELKLFSAPFGVNPVEVVNDLDLELIELQCPESHHIKFVLVLPTEF